MAIIIPTDINGYDKCMFIVKSGKYSGLKEDSFNYLRGKIDFLTESSILIADKCENYKPSIYVVDDEYIESIRTKKFFTEIETYAYISNLAYNVELTVCSGSNEYRTYSILKSNTIDHGISNPYTPSIVADLLSQHVIDEEDYIEKTLDNINSTLMVRPLFLEKLREANLKMLNMDDEVEDEEEYLDEIDVKEITKEVSEKIIGQEEAIKTIVTNIYYNQVLIDSLMEERRFDFSELDSRKVTMLIDGTTGTGKTAIVKEIASQLDLPIVISNANAFSETGYVGPTITDLLENLLAMTNYNLEEAERGIIVLDEIDKIASDKDRGYSQKRGVQEELLTFIGGGEYDIRIPHNRVAHFNTNKITFILMGAFTDIKDKKIKDNESSKIGFDTDNSKKERMYTITPEDYIDYGLMREFFGRIKVIANTKTYTKEDLKEILLTSKISPLKNFDKTVKMFGYDGIDYNDEFIDRVVDDAYDMNTGARGLQTVISGIQNLLLYDLVTEDYKDNLVNLEPSMIDEYKEKKKIKY